MLRITFVAGDLARRNGGGGTLFFG
jgi:hypothetical protein